MSTIFLIEREMFICYYTIIFIGHIAFSHKIKQKLRNNSREKYNNKIPHHSFTDMIEYLIHKQIWFYALIKPLILQPM